MMFTVATYLVEVKSRQSFSDFLQEHIFLPLRMQSTSLQPSRARARGFDDRLATGYVWDKSSATYRGFQSRDCPEGQGAGSVITSVNDFIRWVSALMSHKDPVNAKVYQGLVRMRTIVNPNARRLKKNTSPVMYAAGLEVYFYRGHMVVGHSGTTTGFTSRFFFLPDFKFGGVILGNSDGGASVATILVRELIDNFLGIPEVELPSRHRSKTCGKNLNRMTSTPQTKDQSIAEGDDQGASHVNDESSNQVKKLHKNQKKQKANQKMQQQHGPLVEDLASLQNMPLTAYTGEYIHPGYHTLTVQVKNESLFIDATDRSLGFTLTFEHVRDQTKYIAHLSDFLEGGDDSLEAEFVFEDDRAVKVGLRLENALKNMIWFERVRGGKGFDSKDLSQQPLVVCHINN